MELQVLSETYEVGKTEYDQEVLPKIFLLSNLHN